MRTACLLVTLAACTYSPPGAQGDDDSPTPVVVGFDSDGSMQSETVGVVPIPVVLSEASTDLVTVRYTIGGTATEDDFTLSAGTLTISPGERRGVIELSIKSDNASEGVETVELVLQDPIGATLAIASHTVSITDGNVCVGPPGAFAVCPSVAPTMAVMLPATLDTDDTVICASSQPTGWLEAGQLPACFVFGTTITIGTTIATGSRPLVIAATNSITVGTMLDVASHLGTSTGPGAPGACLAFDQDPGISSSGAAGGAGATFRTKGGNGGDGNGSNVDGRAPNPGATPLLLQAGCNGQPGGEGDGPSGPIGEGGGALYVVAASTLRITGVINASGSGAGITTEAKTGGSGAGSGGMIKLFAAVINATGATLMANGGGGASGAGENGPGNPGTDPVVTAPLVAASGGLGATVGTAGGSGFATGFVATNASNGPGNNEGGGGGGGGGGLIQSNLSLAPAILSAGEIDTP